ncbi:MAG: hypothetical protein AABX82_01770 [Nanoarchaeota archaeon]
MRKAIATTLLVGILSAGCNQEWKSNRDCLYIARQFPEDPACPKLAYAADKCIIPDYMSALNYKADGTEDTHLTVRQYCVLLHTEAGK